MRRVPVLALFLVLLSPRAWSDELDPSQHMWYEASPGTVLEYDVSMYYDWTRTSSREGGVLAAAGRAIDGGDTPGQPWYATHDPAEVDLRGRLQALAPADGRLRFRFTYRDVRVHFFDSTTQVKFDYARKADRDKADKRMVQLNDPKTRERFTKVMGLIDNPFVNQFWRVLAYGKLRDWGFEFSVPARGGEPRLEGLEAALRERLPATVPEEARALLIADAQDFLGMIFPALPDRRELERGVWGEKTRFKNDGLEAVRGRKCLRFANAERKSVTRADDGEKETKQTDRLEESILYSPADRLVLAHERRLKSAVLENGRDDSVFGNGESRAGVRWVRTVTPAPSSD